MIVTEFARKGVKLDTVDKSFISSKKLLPRDNHLLYYISGYQFTETL